MCNAGTFFAKIALLQVYFLSANEFVETQQQFYP